MRKWTLFSFFVISLVMTMVSFAQNPQRPSAGPAGPAKPSNNAPAKPAANTQNPNAVAPATQGSPGGPGTPGDPGSDATVGGPLAPDSDMPVFQNAEGYHYDPTGRRDPFKPYGESQAAMAPETGAPDQPVVPPEPLQTFDVSQFKLLGIIWQVRDPKAMVLDPNGKTHLIRRQTKIGRNNGFVAAIREGEVIVVEPSVGENGVQTAVTRIMNLK